MSDSWTIADLEIFERGVRAARLERDLREWRKDIDNAHLDYSRSIMNRIDRILGEKS